MFWYFVNTTAYHLGHYKLSYFYIKELHDYGLVCFKHFTELDNNIIAWEQFFNQIIRYHDLWLASLLPKPLDQSFFFNFRLTMR